MGAREIECRRAELRAIHLRNHVKMRAVLDEAQRIKNWHTKTARKVKSLRAPHAFVLTGTPIENRIDELYSIVQYLDPELLGPLFRFNRDFYELDERGRPTEYKNLGQLRERVRPLMLRRRKQDVETELPGRTVKTFFVAMAEEQKLRYEDYQAAAVRLIAIAQRRPQGGLDAVAWPSGPPFRPVCTTCAYGGQVSGSPKACRPAW